MKTQLSCKIGGYGRQTIEQPNGRQVEIKATPDLIIDMLMPDEAPAVIQVWSRQSAVVGSDCDVYVRPCEIPSLSRALRDAAEFWGILPRSGGKSAAQDALLSSSVPIETRLSDDLSVVAFPSGSTVGAYAHNLKAQKARMLILSSVSAADAGLCILPSEILPLIDVLGEVRAIFEGEEDECLHTDT